MPYHNNTTIIKQTHDDKDAVINDAHRKTLEDFFIKYFTSHFICKVSKRVTQSLRLRGSWKSKITEIFWPQSYGRQRCVFLVLHGCLTGALESTVLYAGFPYYSSFIPFSTVLLALLLASLPSVQFVGLILPSTLPRGDMDTPPRLRNFFRYLATGMCHFRYLWNGLCDRHRAEITVMQFRGHSLPVRQSYESIIGFFFYLVPFLPTRKWDEVTNCH